MKNKTALTKSGAAPTAAQVINLLASDGERALTKREGKGNVATLYGKRNTSLCGNDNVNEQRLGDVASSIVIGANASNSTICHVSQHNEHCQHVYGRVEHLTVNECPKELMEMMKIIINKLNIQSL
jgi:hypothetical protein